MKKSTSIVLLIILTFSLNINAQKNEDLTKLLNTKNTEFYELLGMLSNYSGKLVFIETKDDKGNTIFQHTDIVEGFEPHELKAFQYFTYLINKIEEKEKIHFNAIIKKSCSNYTSIVSKKMADIINYFYLISNDGRGEIRLVDPILSTPKRQFYYLKGVYKRFGHGDRIRIFNSNIKAKLITDILLNLAFICISQEISQNTYPVVITISCLNLEDRINNNIYSKTKKTLNNFIYQSKYKKLKPTKSIPMMEIYNEVLR